MQKGKQQLRYFIFDFLSACLAWVFLFQFRKTVLEFNGSFSFSTLYFDDNFYKGLLIIPISWCFLYFALGFYSDPYRKSRLREFFQTLTQSILGVLIIFFFLLLDDVVNSYKAYYLTLSFYFSAHFLITYIPRFILSTITVRNIQSKKSGFPTLIVGSSDKAIELINDIESNKVSSGFDLKGFVHIRAGNHREIQAIIPHLGYVKDLQDIIESNKIEEVIVALEPSEHDKIRKILNLLKSTEVYIKITPNLYQMLSGQVKMNSIMGVPLIEINQEIIPKWQLLLKRAMDIVISLFVLILFSPFYLLIGIFIKLGSPGPVFYTQERIGKKKKPFSIFKFRSMRTDAETNKPILAKENDPRVTKFGKFLRKTRLDETPQFFNVLRGEMSLVGPRPERAYFIEKIIKKAPHYAYLQRVKPGITSWGQVKYGYASNVDEMIERLKYDVLYIENMSIMVDLKILIHTVLIVLQSRGK